VLAPSVEEDVAFGPINMGLSRSEVEMRVKEALEMVGLTGFEERAPASSERRAEETCCNCRHPCHAS